MINVKQYKAIAINQPFDPFMGNEPRTVEGYYVKHVTAQPYPMSTPEEHDKFVSDYTKHYIFQEDCGDWGLPTGLVQYEIDINTLQEKHEIEVPMRMEELEQKLLNDPTFQHILKFAPESQRELMTYELARYIYRLMEGK